MSERVIDEGLIGGRLAGKGTTQGVDLVRLYGLIEIRSKNKGGGGQPKLWTQLGRGQIWDSSYWNRETFCVANSVYKKWFCFVLCVE